MKGGITAWRMYLYVVTFLSLLVMAIGVVDVCSILLEVFVYPQPAPYPRPPIMPASPGRWRCSSSVLQSGSITGRCSGETKKRGRGGGIFPHLNNAGACTRMGFSPLEPRKNTLLFWFMIEVHAFLDSPDIFDGKDVPGMAGFQCVKKVLEYGARDDGKEHRYT